MVWRKRGGLRRRGRGRRIRRSKYSKIGRLTVRNTANVGFPDRMIVKMPYYEDFTLINASPAGANANYYWNLNSIWDPNRSGVGHNPSGYANYSAMYNRYRVIGVKARVTYTAVQVPGGATVGPVRCYIYAGNETVQGGSYEQLEQPHTKQALLVPGGNRSAVTLTSYYAIPRLAGVTSTHYKGSDRYQAQFGASPSEVIPLTAGAHAMASGANLTPAISCSVNLTYLVELFDRRNALYTDVSPETRVTPVPEPGNETLTSGV